jgi:hypothetical protein
MSDAPPHFILRDPAVARRRDAPPRPLLDPGRDGGRTGEDAIRLTSGEVVRGRILEEADGRS